MNKQADTKTDFDAMFAVALQLQTKGRMTDAIDLYISGLTAGAQDVHWFHNLGYALRSQGRLAEAAEWFGKGVALHGDKAGLLVGLARVRSQRREAGAEPLLRRALAADPDYASAWTELAEQLRLQGKAAESMALLAEGVERCAKPDRLLVELASLYINMGRRQEAIAALERVTGATPHSGEAWWHWLLAPLPIQVADASEQSEALARFDRHLEQLAATMDADPAMIAPLGKDVGVRQPYFLAYAAENHRARLGRYGDLVCRAAKVGTPAPEPAPKPRPGERVRLAVVSQQIRRHSVWDVVLHGLLNYLDRSLFAVTVLDTGEKKDEETTRAKNLVEHYIPVGRDATRCQAELVKLKPHVIYYPEVGMDPISLKVAALRLAPLQCVGWGHPVSTGLPTIDLYFSGEAIEAADADGHYREKLVRLPGTGACTLPLPVAPAAVKHEYRHRPDSGVVRFFMPHRCFKFDPRDDELIARIVAGAYPCELWLMEDERYIEIGRAVHGRIAAAIEAQGVKRPESLMRIRPWMNRAEFLGMLGEVDVFLDCPAFSGYTTAWQAVHQGLPVLTLEGPFMRQRLAAGLLRQIGCDDLVATDREQYVAIALALAAEARDPAARAARRSAVLEAAPAVDRQVEVVRAFERALLEELGRKAPCPEKLKQQEEQPMNAAGPSPAGSPAAPVTLGTVGLAVNKTPIPWRQLDGPLHMQTLRPDYAPVGLLEMIRPEPAAVLDVGCFCGGTGRWLRNKFPSSRLIGLEPLAQAARVACDAYDQLVEQPVEAVDFAAEGIAAGSLDAIVAADVLEHMANPWRALEKLRPLLSPRGALYVSLPNVRNLTILLGLAKGEWRYTGSGILDITHLRFFTRAQAIEMFSDTGWRLEESRANLDPRLKNLIAGTFPTEAISIRMANMHLENLSPDDVRDMMTLQHFFRIVPA